MIDYQHIPVRTSDVVILTCVVPVLRAMAALPTPLIPFPLVVSCLQARSSSSSRRCLAESATDKPSPNCPSALFIGDSSCAASAEVRYSRVCVDIVYRVPVIEEGFWKENWSCRCALFNYQFWKECHQSCLFSFSVSPCRGRCTPLQFHWRRSKRSCHTR